MNIPSNEGLWRLYRQYNRDFLIANPEVQMTPPSFEGFEFTMQRLREHHEVLQKLVIRWQKGWDANQREINEKMDTLFEKYFGEGFLNVSEEDLRKYTEEHTQMVMEANEHLKYI